MTINRFDVSNRVILITGAGQGIGRAYAKAFADAGAIPIVADVNAANGEDVAARIRETGQEALAIQTDVSDQGSVEAAVDEISKKYGRLDVLINNAAIFTSLDRKPFYDISLAEWEQVMQVNVTGSFIAAKAVAPLMIEAGWGRIINISSASVAMGMPHFMHYVASKAAIVGMTRVMAKELGSSQITVNCIMPGLTKTEVENVGRTQEFMSKVIDSQAIKRIETPDDLLGTVLFLASTASDFVTGQSLIVDGGIVFS
jgi:NAD(P)-dependent dehydrogenase (short-subunit alcohol dehydrogenase family)